MVRRTRVRVSVIRRARAEAEPSATLSVIVPVYNEQFLVGEGVWARLRVLSDTALIESVKVIVVDDGSSDATPEALERFRVWLESQEADPKISWVWVRHKRNAGKGAAIRTGLTYVDPELVVIHDADPLISPARPAEDGGSVFCSRTRTRFLVRGSWLGCTNARFSFGTRWATSS